MRLEAEISNNFGSTPAQVENARLRLAAAMLLIATEGSTNVRALERPVHSQPWP